MERGYRPDNGAKDDRRCRKSVPANNSFGLFHVTQRPDVAGAAGRGNSVCTGDEIASGTIITHCPNGDKSIRSTSGKGLFRDNYDVQFRQVAHTCSIAADSLPGG